MDDPIAEFRHWYATRPIITRIFMTFSFILAAITSLNFVTIFDLFYNFEQTYSNMELWRPITSLLYQGKIQFSFIFSMYFAYFALQRAERGIFKKEQLGDLLMLILYLFGGMLLAGSVIDLYFIGDGFYFALIYIWCKVKPFQKLTLVFGIQVSSGYFPWVYLGVSILLGKSFYVYLCGFAWGHLYFFIKNDLIRKYRRDFLPTPSLFKSIANLYLSRWGKDNQDKNDEQDYKYEVNNRNEDHQRNEGNKRNERNENDDEFEA